MTNSADLDQLASSGSTLFAKIGHVMLSKRRVNSPLGSKPELVHICSSVGDKYPS